MPLLGETVEASREKRLERQQARLRDRGGIFKPSDHNPLLHLLLARGVNGESLSRANSPRRSRSRSASPSRKEQAARRRSQSAPPKKQSRKSEGKRAAPPQSDEEGDAYPEAQAEEPVAGPSRPSAHTKAIEERATKRAPRKPRARPAKHEPNEEQDGAVIKPSTSAPSKPKAPAKGTKASKATASDPVTKPKRVAKRKAPSPEPDPEPEPLQEPNPDTHIPSDDERLVPRKKSRTKSATGPKAKVSSSKRCPKATAEEEVVPQAVEPEPAKPRRRVTTKAKPAQQLQAVAEEDEGTPPPPPARLKRLTKGKRKAEPDLANDEPREGITTAPPSRTKRPKNDPAPPEPDSEVDAPKPRKRKPVGETVDTLPAGTAKPAAGLSTKLVPHVPSDDDDVPLPPGEHRKAPIAPSSPEVALARTVKTAKPTKPAASKPLPDRTNHDSTEEVESEAPLLPLRKRRPPDDEDAPMPIKSRTAKLPPPSESPLRKVSRSRAPPIFAPKGTVLKPKPKPRMSMFPAPAVDEESDKDPIDFLSSVTDSPHTHQHWTIPL